MLLLASRRRLPQKQILGPRSKFILPALSLAALALSACGKKPTQDQCNALADHMAWLLSQARVKNAEGATVMKEKERDRFVMVCVREGSHKVVDCMLAATRWDQLIAQCGELVR